MEEARTRQPGNKGPQILAAVAACIGAFGLGTVLGWTSPANPQLREEWGDISPNDTTTTWGPESLIGSLVPLGGLASAPVAGFAVDKFGRKTSMLILSAPFVLGWLLITYATSGNGLIYVGRFITGFCGGAFSLAAPVYIGETAEDSIRGMLGAGFQLMVTIGILFVYCVGIGPSWEWLSLICGFGPLIFLILMIFPPESPRWLVSKGRITEASESLRWLRGAKSSQDVEDELADIQKSVDHDKQLNATFKDLLQSQNSKPVLIGLALMLFQQLSGVNAVIFYATTIFKDANVDMEPEIATIVIGIVQVVATIASSILMDRAGRRVLLLLSDVAMGICLVALGVFFYLKDEDKDVSSLGWLPLVSLIGFIVAFSLGFGPIPWLMMGELLPPHIKGLASSICTMFNWFLAFLVTQFFGSLKDGLGAAGCYWLFAAVCGAGTVFVFIFLPETKGKSLDEIQRFFGGGAGSSSAPQPSTSNDEKKRDEE